MIVPRAVVTSHCLAAFLLAACAGRQKQSETAAAAGIPNPVVLEVQNHNWADVVLYILHDGTQTRFAQVRATEDLAIEIPASLQGQMGVIRLAARRIGGKDSFVSEAISLRGSSAVRFTIESTLSRSSVGVW